MKVKSWYLLPCIRSKDVGRSYLLLKSIAKPIGIEPDRGMDSVVSLKESDFDYWSSQGFSLLITSDGSPSFRIGDGESMHHTAGAYSETEFIYGSIIDQAMQALSKQELTEVNVCVVGLGMGYIEMCVAKMALHYDIPASKVRITSWESSPVLRENFQNWILEKAILSAVGLYDCIESYFSSGNPDRYKIKSWLKELYSLNRLCLCEALDQNSLKTFLVSQSADRSWNVVCYDAFSAKTTLHLWAQDFLGMFLDNLKTAPCWFSTYACTGILKRALKNAGFTLDIKEGFAGKKNSTFAIKLTTI